jgi:hypothetical protein
LARRRRLEVLDLLQHGSGAREANTSPGRNSTGSRLTCASAAAVTRFVAPGPIDVVHAIMRRRKCAFA